MEMRISLKDLLWDAVIMDSVVSTVYFTGNLLENDRSVLLMRYQVH